MTPIKRPPLTRLEFAAQRFTDWVGSTGSIIVHTILFIASFVLTLFGISVDKVLLVLTTAVSLEAIYLAIFIQMTVNRNTESLEGVEEDIDEIEKDVDVLQKEVVEMSEDIEDIAEEDQQEASQDEKIKIVLETIEGRLQQLVSDIEYLKSQH